jgi:hypothetical protein
MNNLTMFLKKTFFASLVPVLLTGLLVVSCSTDDTNPLVNAKTPSITTQPTGGSWNIEEEEQFNLTVVTAAVTDGGTLSYQWYENTTNSAIGGDAVSGATSATLTLDSEDYEVGDILYFYVAVTNTIADNGDGGVKTATATSSVATVTVTDNSGTREWEWDLPTELSGFFQTEFADSYMYTYAPDLSGYDYIDGFFIDATTKQFGYYFDTSLEYGWGGTIAGHVPGEDNDEISVLIIEIDWAEKNTASPFAEYITLPDTGKFFAYSYKNLVVSGNETLVSTGAPYNADGENTGVATLQEAITEYTAENGYFANSGLYIGRGVTPTGLTNLEGTWADGDEEFFMLIRGTGITYFLEDEDTTIGVYDGDDYEMTAVIGIIVDYTDPTQSSGVLYIQVIESDFGFTYKKYVAIAWRNKSDDSIDFMICTDEEDTLAAVKAAYPESSNTYFADNGFDSYEKQ